MEVGIEVGFNVGMEVGVEEGDEVGFTDTSNVFNREEDGP
jgi:hypothetical protein